MDVIRVLMADDHTLFRRGLRALLESFEELEVVGEAATGREAVSMANELMPDLILMDIRMPGISGIEATTEVLKDNPHIGIILVSMYDDAESIFSGMRAGARGYVLKEAASILWARSASQKGLFENEITRIPGRGANGAHPDPADKSYRPGPARRCGCHIRAESGTG